MRRCSPEMSDRVQQPGSYDSVIIALLEECRGLTLSHILWFPVLVVLTVRIQDGVIPLPSYVWYFLMGFPYVAAVSPILAGWLPRRDLVFVYYAFGIAVFLGVVCACLDLVLGLSRWSDQTSMSFVLGFASLGIGTGWALRAISFSKSVGYFSPYVFAFLYLIFLGTYASAFALIH